MSGSPSSGDDVTCRPRRAEDDAAVDAVLTGSFAEEAPRIIEVLARLRAVGDLRAEVVAEAGGEVVGMNMRVDHVEDAHAGRLGGFEIRRDVADRIDNGGGSLAAAAEEVRCGDGIEMQELTQDHGRVLLKNKESRPADRLQGLTARPSFNNFVE
jgi:hypothetical protein